MEEFNFRNWNGATESCECETRERRSWWQTPLLQYPTWEPKIMGKERNGRTNAHTIKLLKDWWCFRIIAWNILRCKIVLLRSRLIDINSLRTGYRYKSDILDHFILFMIQNSEKVKSLSINCHADRDSHLYMTNHSIIKHGDKSDAPIGAFRLDETKGFLVGAPRALAFSSLLH